MAVIITQFQDNQVLVNNKLVVKDQDGTWIAKIELTNSEHEALNKHIANQ
ncbi:hypothetical protein [Corallibacter sp.]